MFMLFPSSGFKYGGSGLGDETLGERAKKRVRSGPVEKNGQ
jgi:hypothetical protein